MNERRLIELAQSFKNGDVTLETFVDSLKDVETMHGEGVQIDRHRGIRTGFQEVVFCEGKATSHLIGIVQMMLEHNHPFFGTRCSLEQYEAMRQVNPSLEYEAIGRIAHSGFPKQPLFEGNVAVIAAGTSDLPVAREAAITAKLLGCDVLTIDDVGVAGIHRLLSQGEKLRNAKVVIAVAGMEGALPSVVGGLTDAPVIAVPTSVGYGASFNGIAPLLTMLNSCASGVTVVNIDNGFGAGYAAATMLNKIGNKRLL